MVLWYEANSVVWWCVLVGVVIGLCMFSLATLCHKPLSEHKIVPRAPFGAQNCATSPFRSTKMMQICRNCIHTIESKQMVSKIGFMFNIMMGSARPALGFKKNWAPKTQPESQHSYLLFPNRSAPKGQAAKILIWMSGKLDERMGLYSRQSLTGC